MYIYLTVLCPGVLLLALWLPHQHGGRPRRSDVPLPSSIVHTALQVRRPAETMVLLPDGQLRFILPRPSDGPLLWLLAFIYRFVQITVAVYCTDGGYVVCSKYMFFLVVKVEIGSRDNVVQSVQVKDLLG